ncbi:hypothetical protein [Microbacterium sp. AK031]|uniref:hypothetical protein n=1 Tax=Microbacterium sp. AK031 TaxID=2723076 RepID=UPI002168DB51|nr:hypothetical protein [Microbacterium sp. AK031]MCS3843484.1 peptide/nickel transport system substrate-binding protein [Microbacterium sp. AK031]
MRGRRRVAALTAGALVVGLTACTPALPETVVLGTTVVVGWSGEFTSANAAASPTTGNIDIAAMTRGRFGDVVDGDFVPDEGFGTVEIVSDDPFTVRYDVTEPAWSDGIPLDAADLLLGWAGAAGYFPQAEDSETDAVAPKVPVVDEFARSMDVTFAQPIDDWQSAVTVPVPAHVLGALAFGIDDPMEAKQAVITAIRTSDDAAIEEMGAVWNEGFEFGEDAEPAGELLLSSGPFLVDSAGSGEGEGMVLVPNPAYRGPVTPQVARVELVPPGDDPLGLVGAELDVVQVSPTAANHDAVRELERKDFTVNTTNDGTVWAMLLKPAGVFSGVPARTAFIHAVPQRDLTDRGGGAWAASFAPTTSMITAPGSRAYDVVNEDSGFLQTLGATDTEPDLEREHAGFAPGTSVCVLYDRGSEFAVGAFAAMREAAAEAGWNVVDCGSDDFGAAFEQRGWDAAIARVPIPRTPEQIAAQWGSGGAEPITGQTDPDRDALIAKLAQTTDVYEAREIQAQIEATIVRAAVALPLAANPVLTVVDRGTTGVATRNGTMAMLTSGATQWAVVP